MTSRKPHVHRIAVPKDFALAAVAAIYCNRTGLCLGRRSRNSPSTAPQIQQIESLVHRVHQHQHHDLRLEMSEDSDREEQSLEDPGGEVYEFFRYLYELEPKDSHLAYEAWYELPFEEKAFWAKVLQLERRLGVSYKGGVDSSVPHVPSDIIELGISAATKVSVFPLEWEMLLMCNFPLCSAGLKRDAS